MLGFTLAVTLFATLLFGLAPGFIAAFRNGARNIASARITTTGKRQRLSRALVVAEVAVSLVLLIGAALLTSSLRELHKVQPGFDAKNVLTFSISLPERNSSVRKERIDFFAASRMPSKFCPGSCRPPSSGRSPWRVARGRISTLRERSKAKGDTRSNV